MEDSGPVFQGRVSHALAEMERFLRAVWRPTMGLVSAVLVGTRYSQIFSFPCVR